MRSQMFLLGLPTLLAALCICFYKTKRVCKIQLTILCVGLISVVCLHFFDSSMYKDGGYDYYAAYQGPRSFFGDGGFYDMESAYDELKERGMCAADLRVLRSWYYYDKDAFALDSLNKIIDVVSRSNYEINYLKMPLAVMIAMSHAFVGSNVWCWLLLCFVYIFYSKYGFRYLPWLSLGIVAISYFYLLLVNRVVAHVEVGGWLYACVLLIPFIGSDNVVYSKIKSLFPCLSVLCILGCVVARSFYVMPDVLSKGFVITQKQSSMWIEFERYALNHPNDVFLLPFDVYKMYAEYYAMPHESIKPNSWNNIVSLGYWNINLPSMENELQKRGVANPMLDILRENVYVLEERTPVLPNYFKEHYNKVLFADTITNFGDAFLLRYRLEGNNEKFR